MAKKLNMQKVNFISIVAVLAIITSACLGSFPTQTQSPPATVAIQQETPAQSSSGAVPAWLQVYFTNPNPPDQVDQGIDKVVVQAVEQASLTIDVASFDFTLPSFTNALVNASKRGVKVCVGQSGTT